MSRLRPCPACNRHVYGDEQHCPFCQAAMPLAQVAQAGSPPLGRLSRIAVLAAGATLVGGIAAAGCDDDGPRTADGGAATGGRGRQGDQGNGGNGGNGVNDGGANQDVRPPVDVPIYAAAVALLKNQS